MRLLGKKLQKAESLRKRTLEKAVLLKTADGTPRDLDQRKNDVRVDRLEHPSEDIYLTGTASFGPEGEPICLDVKTENQHAVESFHEGANWSTVKLRSRLGETRIDEEFDASMYWEKSSVNYTERAIDGYSFESIG